MIVGLMAIGSARLRDPEGRCADGVFPFYKECLGSLCQLADRVIVRWDVRCRDIEAYMGIQEVCQEKLADLIIGVSKWNRWNWREILLRRIDTLGLAPTLVLTSDQDEQFSEGVKDDLDRLLASDRKALMFKYEMVTCDGANVPLYPGEAHMKAYKWQPGLSYRGYRFHAQVTNYARRDLRLAARSKVKHLRYYTPELRAGRR